MSDPTPFRLSFVCTGNICRSPMGEVIFRSLAETAGDGERFAVTSRGTHGYHVGQGAHPRSVAAMAAAGYDGSAHRATRLSAADVAENDLLIALDRGHERILLEMGASPEQVQLLTAYDPAAPSDPDVFDPYDREPEVYAAVLEQIERSCRVLFAELDPARPPS